MRRLFAFACLLLLAGQASGYVFITGENGLPVKWYSNTIPIRIEADNTTQLFDGSTRATSIQAAMTDSIRGWNHNLGAVQFAPSIVSGPPSLGNSLNEISFSSSVYGDAWDSGVLAVTISNFSGDQLLESDIVFNTGFLWDSYRGTLRSNNVIDIQRVALHELGHVLGLDHPDANGQSVSAIMNASISDIDSLQADDISGGQALYGAPGVSAANDNFVNAIVLDPNTDSQSLTVSNLAASKEPGEPNHAGDAGGRSVWWRWTARANGFVTVTTNNSSFDTTLAAYTGAAVSSLTEVVSNDDANSSVHSSAISFNSVSGTTYYFAVDGHGGDRGTIVLGFSFQGPISPVFNAPLVDRTANEGDTVYFGVFAQGRPTPDLQWQRLPQGSAIWENLTDGGAYSGSTTERLAVGPLAFAMSGDQFRCVATNTGGSITTNAATLTVYKVIPPGAPTITGIPATLNINESDSFSFTATVTGTPTISLQWSHDGVDLPLFTAPGASFHNVSAAAAGTYTLTAKNGGGTTTASCVVTVNVSPLPVLVLLVHSFTDTVYGSFTVNVLAYGATPMTFQWAKDGVPVPGFTNPILTILNAKLSDGGQYTLTATNANGSTTSDPLTIIIQPYPVDTISSQPASLTVPAGHSALFRVTSTNFGGTTFQWQVLRAGSSSWQDIGSSDRLADYLNFKSPDLTVLTEDGTAKNGNQYRCAITNLGGTIYTDPATLTLGGSVVLPLSDFNYDGHPDILWSNISGIDRAVWYLNGTNIAGFDYLAGIPGEWIIVGTADLDGDGKADIVWENVTTGDRTVWFMDGMAIKSFGYLAYVDPVWHIAALGDLDGDGQIDLIWENRYTGDRAVWYMSGTTIKSFGYIAGIDPSWSIKGAADFDGDGHTDLVWERVNSGDCSFWLMDNTTILSFSYLANVPGGWAIAKVADFDGDGQVDLLWENTLTGDRAIWLMQGVALGSQSYLAYVPNNWHIAP